METTRTVKGLIKPGDWLLKLDLKDAYLTVPIHQNHRKYLRFHWHGQTWQFQVLPFGLNSAPCTFMKLTKPIVSILRRLGVRVIIYLDDMLLMAKSAQEASAHLRAAVEILVALGFVVNSKKSVFQPSQRLEFLGFVINSKEMVISLPHQRLQSLRSLAKRTHRQERVTIRQLAQLLGMMTAAHPAILPAPLHYRHLERTKIQAARQDPSMIYISTHVKLDLQWWVEQSQIHNGRPLQIMQWDLTIESDASLTGWGASCLGRSTGGPWSQEERTRHINYLELKAAFLALKTFVPSQRTPPDGQHHSDCLPESHGRHPLSTTFSISSRNTGVVYTEENYNSCGTHPRGGECPGLSRHLEDSSDWRLNRNVFLELENRVGPFSIDLFASRTNAQLEVYCSWRPDPEAIAVDALSIAWAPPPLIHVPTVCPHTSGPGETPEERSSSNPCRPSVVRPDVVSQDTGMPSRPPVLLPPLSDIVTNPEGQQPTPPTGCTGQVSSGRLACIRGAYEADSLSEGVISVLRKS